MLRIASLAALLVSTALPAVAQQINPPGNTLPQPTPITDTIPVARDIDYPGTIKLEVDATDTVQNIFRVKETIPVARTGHMVLLMPKWLPGKHGPRGEIEKLAGLVVRANGRELPWTRDVVDVHAFHIDVPAGARTLDVQFQFLTATQPDQGRIAITPEMLSLQWESVSLYPAGYYTRRIPVEATVRYPAGWTAAAGLPSTVSNGVYRYERTSYETLVDSPVLAGKYFKRFQLTDRVGLNVTADKPSELAATPEQIAAHTRLVEQAVKLFGAQHYDKYEFLLSISDKLGSIGLEHHRSSENGVDPGYFTDWASGPGERNLLPHEFTHSWDGKYRRGADLFTPDFRTPMRNSLLWMYEGQTQFWGYVLQARSGLVSKQDTLDAYADIAAALDAREGRQWRPLVDTTNDPIISARRPKGWVSWQRSEDYYNEGLLVWMEVDSMLRAQSNGAKSMDDFARAFFGMRDGDWGVLPYTLADVVRTLNGIQPYDWAGFLDKRLNARTDRAPIGGFAANGYRIVYTDTPTPYLKGREKSGGGASLPYSLGLTVNKEGKVGSVLWGSPAYKAGFETGTTLIAVAGQAYTPDRLREAVTAAKGAKEPIRLTVRMDDAVKEIQVPYHDGLRYPRLEKVGEGENGLDRLLTAK
ncbi:M61 family metallopeptidase [Sphingomonas sp. Leaf25]|uniref:M61 family metallopeptidase n=1 Tax=Sphingomonas sp. Leaf25 TaxID=1735692 RepID=UPI000700C3E1|nr:M61 family metallopeptidase [Sphingomonas sp. Leaf25]KQN03635.1 peptidase M61 [Sphingomonas sp. Leaf25]